MRPRIPTVARIVWQDFTSSLMTRVLVALWAFYLIGWIMQLLPWPQAVDVGAAAVSRLIWFAAAYTLIGGPILAWRVWSIRRVFQVGKTVEGQVERVSLVRGRGIVEFHFALDDVHHEATQTIKTTKQARELRQGEKVEVVVDPNKPDRCYLREIYCPADGT